MSRRNRRPKNAERPDTDGPNGDRPNTERPNKEPSPVTAATIIIIAILAGLCLSFGILFCLLAVHGLHAEPRSEKPMTIEEGSSRIEVSVGDGKFNVSDAELRAWVQNAADSVATYYGRYPVAHVALRISPGGRPGVGHGMTFPHDGGGLIKIRVGTDTTASDFADDWMLTHEMTHLAFPSMPDDQHWIEEGIATYVEPIARVRAHRQDENKMWFELVRDLHQGLPQPGDEGLDRTHSWASTYWGGALFCFLADVEIHRETQNKKGLDNALRAILNAGGNINEDWTLPQALKVGDRATGSEVLTRLYGDMGPQPHMVDLDAMWHELGVTRVGDHVTFDDAAPMAATRRAITWGQGATAPQAKLVPTAPPK
ncbi:MAG: hypothetical protein WA823_19220 [Candidatus Acidiferrales bacterium]